MLAIVLATFVREREQLLIDIGFWFFSIPFVVSLVSMRAGVLAGVLLLTISPGLHHHLNLVAGTHLNAWSFAGVDCAIGFVTAWIVRGGFAEATLLLQRFPSGAVLALHAWVALSALIATVRNVWQSASELTLRGFAYNAWLIRALDARDDFFPLQDVYYFGVAVVTSFCLWALARRYGTGLVHAVLGMVLVGATGNAAFALVQKTTGTGWFAGAPTDVNSFWPDIHSFAGLMAIALAIGVGRFAAGNPTGRRRALIAAAMLASMLGLYLSGSRSTLLIVVVVLSATGAWAAMVLLRGWHRTVVVSGVLLLVFTAGLIFAYGYRGVSFETLGDAFDASRPGALNSALSHRPEIWWAALRMYADFPLFGLGQGTFHRLSAIADFSRSEALVIMGGGGAHNYFLHTFVELGPVGAGIVVLIAIPFVRAGSINLKLVSFYALLGIAVGNVYGHSLLVREMLVLGAVCAGLYVWQIQTVAGDRWRAPSRGLLTAATIVLVPAAIGAVAQAGASFAQEPFTYGRRCFETHPLQADSWTTGYLRTPVPRGAVTAKIDYVRAPLDVQRRGLDVEFWIMDSTGARRLHASRSEAGDASGKSLVLQLGDATEERHLEIRPSHCFVPLDLGYPMNRRHDTRRLGIQLTGLHFSEAHWPATR